MIKLGLYSSIANPPRGDDPDRCARRSSPRRSWPRPAAFTASSSANITRIGTAFCPRPSSSRRRSPRVPPGSRSAPRSCYCRCTIPCASPRMSPRSTSSPAAGSPSASVSPIRKRISVPSGSSAGTGSAASRKRFKSWRRPGRENGSATRAGISISRTSPSCRARSNGRAHRCGSAPGCRRRSNGPRAWATPSS